MRHSDTEEYADPVTLRRWRDAFVLVTSGFRFNLLKDIRTFPQDPVIHKHC